MTGVGRVAATLLRDLVALGAEVTAVDHQDNPVARALCGDCRVLPCRGRFLRMGRWHLDLLRRIPGLGIDHDVLFDPTGYPDAFGSHPRLALLVHDLSMFEHDLYRRGKRTWFRLFYRRALGRARLLVCVSEHTRRQLLAHFPLDPQRCVVVPNSIAPEFAEPPVGPPHPDMPQGPFLLAVGTIERRKNSARLLDAFAAAGLPHTLVLAGRPGAGSADLEARIAALGDRVRVLTGPTDDELRHLYRSATALVFPSLDEGFGLPILEAMQCDLPVLTSNVAAMPEVAGDAALQVDPTDVAAIRAGIERIVNDRELRSELVARGRDNLARFDPRTNAKALLTHLQGLR